jgi:hypothetical protein
MAYLSRYKDLSNTKTITILSAEIFRIISDNTNHKRSKRDREMTNVEKQ